VTSHMGSMMCNKKVGTPTLCVPDTMTETHGDLIPPSPSLKRWASVGSVR